MLTEDQIRVVGDALLLYSEKPNAWFAPIPELEPVADELFVKGYLNRVERDGRAMFQITRRAVAAQELHAAGAFTVTDN